jgi:sporulation protein YlmC with PRC-barrel domain
MRAPFPDARITNGLQIARRSAAGPAQVVTLVASKLSHEHAMKRIGVLAAIVFVLVVGYAAVEGRDVVPVARDLAREGSWAGPHRLDSIDLVAASDLVERPVMDRRGQPVGALRSILIDSSSGALRAAILELAGDDPTTCRYVVVPWSALTLSERKSGPLALRIDLQQGLTSPRFQTVNLAEAGIVEPRRPPDKDAALRGSPRAIEALNSRQAPPALVSLEDIIDAPVHPALGPPLGRVAEVAIDVDRGVAAYILVPRSSAGQPGWLPIPFSVLVWCTAEQRLIAITDPTVTATVAINDRAEPPRRLSADALGFLYREYGASPYWWPAAGGTARL